MSNYPQQLQKMKASTGFVAALDQSGGSTPKALSSYGIKENAWSNEAEMFALVHQMRTRIISSPSFTGERILGAILFENTMDSDIEGQPSADFLWNAKRVVPFLKVDQGLAAEKGGVQLLRPMPNLAALLAKAKAKHIFGTKMRSFIKQANATSIKDIVNQQFEAARQIIAAGLVPIIEPEVDIHCPEKALAEGLLKTALLEKLNELPVGQLVMLKLTLPEQGDLYENKRSPQYRSNRIADRASHERPETCSHEHLDMDIGAVKLAPSILTADFARLGKHSCSAGWCRSDSHRCAGRTLCPQRRDRGTDCAVTAAGYAAVV